MISSSDSGEDDPDSTVAHFQIVMNCNAFKSIPDRDLKNPKFWEFFESTQSESYREKWADNILRRDKAEIPERIFEILTNEVASEEARGMPQESEETREANFSSIFEGGTFRFLRDAFCKVDEGGEEDEGKIMGEEAEEEDKESTTQGLTGSRLSDSDIEAEQQAFKGDVATATVSEDQGRESRRSTVSETEAEQRSLGQDQVTDGNIWEWSRYDSKAERWWSEQEKNRVRAVDGVMQTVPVKDDKAWEWTQYESEAEAEEVIREFLRD